MEKGNMRQQEDWIRSHWRPMMAFVYMAVVIFDFIVGPIFWSIIQIYGGSVSIQWSPLTLIAGGVFHAAMGAVLGISAFTRGKEKVESIKTQYHDGRDDNSKHWNNDSLM
jgi:hypothetical protein